MSRLSAERESELRADDCASTEKDEIFAELDVVRAHADGLAELCTHLQRELDAVRARLKGMQADCDDANANWSKCEEENDRLEAELDAVRAERDALLAAATEVADRLETARRHDCNGADCATCNPNGLAGALRDALQAVEREENP